MQKAIRVRNVGLFSAFLLLFGNSVCAQQLADRPRQAAMRTFAYDTTQETVVEGTVLSYTAKSATPPVGTHLILQTAAGAIDVHLGAASFLEANHFSLAKGDSVDNTTNSISRARHAVVVCDPIATANCARGGLRRSHRCQPARGGACP